MALGELARLELNDEVAAQAKMAEKQVEVEGFRCATYLYGFAFALVNSQPSAPYQPSSAMDPHGPSCQYHRYIHGSCKLPTYLLGRQKRPVFPSHFLGQSGLFWMALEGFLAERQGFVNRHFPNAPESSQNAVSVNIDAVF